MFLIFIFIVKLLKLYHFLLNNNKIVEPSSDLFAHVVIVSHDLYADDTQLLSHLSGKNIAMPCNYGKLLAIYGWCASSPSAKSRQN